MVTVWKSAQRKPELWYLPPPSSCNNPFVHSLELLLITMMVLPMHPVQLTVPWAGHGISASIDDIRMFNAALSASQIKALYDLGKAGR